MNFGIFIAGLLVSVQLFAVNLNTATLEELNAIRGIGAVTAKKIIDYRNKNKFKSIDEVENVKGIGEKRFSIMKKELSV